MSKPLPLYPGSVLCVQCGFCCRVRSCGYGEWDNVKKVCKELKSRGDGTYECGVYDKIINGKDKTWEIAPAFGAGCCSSINADRQAVLRRIRGNV